MRHVECGVRNEVFMPHSKIRIPHFWDPHPNPLPGGEGARIARLQKLLPKNLPL